MEPTTARVERDPETGKILRVIHEGRDNPLNDPLNDVEDGEEFDGLGDDEVGNKEGGEKDGNEIVRLLEEQASMGKATPKRKQSEREKEWIERLVGRWGESYGRMARDRRLNPMQQTEADIKRRVEKWRAEGGSVAAEE
jgi:nucleolar protein 16